MAQIVKRFVLRVTAAAGLTLACATVMAAPPGGTARARLTEARAAATKWQPDATLVTVSALQANDDGTAPRSVVGWVYTFHSKKTGKWIGIHAEANGLEQQALPAGMTTPVPAEFVDSDKVLAEVRKHGFKKSGDTLLGLMLVGDRNLKTGVYWCATSAADVTPGMWLKSWCVDPKSGKFVARLAGGGVAASVAKPADETTSAVSPIDPSKCGGFGANDAAAQLGLPASQVTGKTEKVAENEWRCTYTAGAGKVLTFTIAAAKTVKEAQTRMDQYRSKLGDDYTEISLGDDGVWANASGTFTVRKGNVTVHTLQPADKIKQVKLAKAVLDRF